jgi:hypothetical protein
MPVIDPEIEPSPDDHDHIGLRGFSERFVVNRTGKTKTERMFVVHRPSSSADGENRYVRQFDEALKLRFPTRPPYAASRNNQGLFCFGE